MRLARRLLLVASAVGIVALAPFGHAAGRDPGITTVGVYGHGHAMAGGNELQIGNQAWKITQEGEAVVETPAMERVIVWRTSDCHPLVQFVAQYDSRNTVNLGDGSGPVTVNKGGGGESTYTYGPAHAPLCPLPETSTSAVSSGSTSSGFWLIMGLALASGLWAFKRFAPSGRRTTSTEQKE